MDTRKDIKRNFLWLIFSFTFVISSITVDASDNNTLLFEPEFYSLPNLGPGAQFGPFGPKYPLTSAWFRDRFSETEWNKTLTDFKDAGGDTVILRAPSIVIQSRDDFLRDPDFQWCRVQKQSDDISCYDDAIEELSVQGLNVTAVGKFDYEEDYSVENMIVCSVYEKRLVTSRVYYRLVFHMETNFTKPTCDLKESRVMVLFTSFAGIDPHQLLLQSAHDRNISVYFGLPQLPTTYGAKDQNIDFSFSVPYLQFTQRLLQDHRYRYGLKQNPKSSNLYDTLNGYFYSSDVMLNSDIITNVSKFKHLSEIGDAIHVVGKRFAVSSYYSANKLLHTASLVDYLVGFETMAPVVDVISVRDGRGYGNGAYYWETQLDFEVSKIDPDLYRILKDIKPDIAENATYRSLFTFSIQEIFYKLSVANEEMAKTGTDVDLWLNIEAFDFLRDDPCLPVDKSGSGLNQVMNRVIKSRLDHVLTHAGAYISKVTSDAWDPCFTCKASYNSSLAGRIKADYGRPIIANCSFHSSFNRSVVIIGYNLLAETQGFTVSWPTFDGHRQTSHSIHGYYFEIDWGIQHGRVPSLMYTQLYDPYDVVNLAPKGWVHVSVDGGYNSCSFTYDFTQEPAMEHRSESMMKKYYLSVKYPKRRVYGQNDPFPFQHRLYNRKQKL